MKFSDKIIDWYKSNKRSLPWRETTDPYKIWLSEIILQQTRVNQGLPYYLKFVETFPTVHKLADAPEDEVLKLWQGLGYYSRARNLHYTAKYIRNKYAGVFPHDPEKISSLKGIGEYTTAAIASFAFGHPLAVVDGNVVRVLSRFYNLKVPFDSSAGKKIFREAAFDNLHKKDPGTYNQAIMEFGAVVCKPANPQCFSCPLNTDCQALAFNIVEKLPVKKTKVNVKKRNFNYLVEKDMNTVFLRQRTEKDIWQNLYEFPLIETKKKVNQKTLEKKVKSRAFLAASYIHKLSHREIHADFWVVNDLKTDYLPVDGYIRISSDEIKKYPVSRLMDRFINEQMPTGSG